MVPTCQKHNTIENFVYPFLGTDEERKKYVNEAFSDIFNQLDEKSKTEWLPTYQEADDREKGFWSRAFAAIKHCS